MFSGIGGFEYGIEEAWKSVQGTERRSVRHFGDKSNITSWCNEQPEKQRYRIIEQPKNIGYSEIDKHAIQIYEKHFKHKNYGDATKINPRDLPDFDLLVGGFPCQAFSIAGKRKGFDDTRGTLFFDIARILAEKRPRLVVLENVKGLLSHEGGKTFQTIIGVLTDLGYFVEWQVLNSKNFGVPQNRERVFIIGHLGRCCGRQVFPLGATDEQATRLQGSVSNTLTTRYEGATATGTYVVEDKLDAQIQQLNQPKHSSQRVYDPSGISPTITAGNLGGGKSPSKILQINQPTHSNDRVYGTDGISPTLNTMQGGNRQPFVAAVLTPDRLKKRQNGRRFKENGEPSFTLTSQDRHGVMIPEATKQGYAVAEEGDSINLAVPNSQTRRGRVGRGIAQTLDTGMQQHTLRNMRIRRLTPVECERLQGYPDGWTDGISDTQRYKCLGNAVTTNVITYLFGKLL